MIPAAISRALRPPILTAEQFTPTKWDDASVKQKFGNHLLRFIAEDHPESLFRDNFYRRLSNTFMFIAHYNRAGFWSEYFEHHSGKIEFLTQIAKSPCWGDPAFTYSDVEKIVGEKVRSSGVIDWHRRLLAQEIERGERALYERLHQKFNAANQNPAGEIHETLGDTPFPRRPPSSVSPPHSGQQAASSAPQPDLFGGL